MRRSNYALVGAALAGALSLSSPSHAAVTVLGAGLARLCYESADAAQPSKVGLQNCTRALNEEALSQRDRAATFVNRGILHMYDKDLDKALADYDAGLALKPNLAEAYVNKGIALLHRGGQDREAVAALSRGIELNTSQPEVAYYSRGVVNELLGDAKAAYNDYRQAAALKPDWREPTTQLARFTVVSKTN